MREHNTGKARRQMATVITKDKLETGSNRRSSEELCTAAAPVKSAYKAISVEEVETERHCNDCCEYGACKVAASVRLRRCGATDVGGFSDGRC